MSSVMDFETLQLKKFKMYIYEVVHLMRVKDLTRNTYTNKMYLFSRVFLARVSDDKER